MKNILTDILFISSPNSEKNASDWINTSNKYLPTSKLLKCLKNN